MKITLISKKNEEESSIERLFEKKMENYFATLFEDFRHERFSLTKLWLTKQGYSRQALFADHETKIMNILALGKLHRQKTLTECIPLHLLD